MKKKRKLIHRLGAFMCALVVAVSCMGVVPYYASENSSNIVSYLKRIGLYEFMTENCGFEYNSNYGYTVGFEERYTTDEIWVTVRAHEVEPNLYYVSSEYGDYINYKSNGCFKYRFYFRYDSNTFSVTDAGTYSNDDSYYQLVRFYPESRLTPNEFTMFYSDYTVYNDSSLNGIKYSPTSWSHINFDYSNDVLSLDKSAPDSGGGEYNGELGYLKDLDYDIAYESSVFGTYDESSRTDRFRFNTISTSGLNLTSGNYSIRHYIRPVLCNGYEDNNVIEEYDKYLMGEYPASSGEFRYKRADYDLKFEEYGYDGIGFVDAYLLGRFILEWHYLQIVNNDTGEFGGYVLMKPKNASGDFGVERVAMTVDIDENPDIENGYGDTIIDSTSSGGATIDEALENTDKEKLSDLEGVEQFADNVEAYASQVGNVTKGVGALFASFPSWILGLLGFGLALTVLVAVVKGIRG